jgi:YjbE family integral membrane protein
MSALLYDPNFWLSIGQIMLVNIVLSGDNAVVIALAARSLPERDRDRAVAWGSVAAILMRIGLSIVALQILRLPYLKIAGSAALFFIALKLLTPGEGHSKGVSNQTDLGAAIRTILLADLVMSLDNVLAVAAAAKGNHLLLIFGLGISIPLVIFGSTMILRLMERYPSIITLGAAILGFVAGEMLVSEPALAGFAWLNEGGPAYTAIPIASALGVIVVGKWLKQRTVHPEIQLVDLAHEQPQPPSDPSGE